MTLRLRSRSAAATERLAARLAALLRGGEVVLLTGELGAGKTCFVRGLARGLGIDPRRVKSPTYNVLHCYGGGRRELDHFDAYFMREHGEFRRAGLDDFLAGAHVIAIEWADRYPELDVPDPLHVALEHVDEEIRRITLDGGSARARAALAALAAFTDDEVEEDA